jgi:zinc protease
VGGIAAHSLDELISTFAGQTVQPQPSPMGALDDRFLVGAQTKPDLLPLQLQILTAYAAAPGFREDGLARFRRSIEASYDTIDDSPQAVEQLFAVPLVQGGGAVFAWPAKEALLALDFEDARAAMTPALAESYLEVAIVGDVDVEAAIAAAAATFGALPARADAPAPIDPAAAARFPEPPAEPVVLRHDGGADQARVLTYWPTTDDRDPRHEWTMELVRRVLGDKLLDRVREADGVSYGPGAALSMSGVHEGFGYIRAGLDLTPDTADGYFAVIDELAAELAAGGVDDDAFERAKKPLLETLGPRDENNAYWADLLSRAQREPRRLDEHRNDRAQIESITREEVIAAAATYLDPAKAYRIVILPEAE